MFTVHDQLISFISNDPDCRSPALRIESDNPSTYTYPFSAMSDNNNKLIFEVRSPSDAYISLSPQKYDTENMYEIILGPRNRFGRQSSIKRCPLCKDGVKVDATLQRSVFVSDHEWRRFWIQFGSHNDGDGKVVMIGRDGEAKPFLVLEDTKDVRPRYVGLSTGKDIVSEFRFCNLCKY